MDCDTKGAVAGHNAALAAMREALKTYVWWESDLKTWVALLPAPKTESESFRSAWDEAVKFYFERDVPGSGIGPMGNRWAA